MAMPSNIISVTREICKVRSKQGTICMLFILCEQAMKTGHTTATPNQLTISTMCQSNQDPISPLLTLYRPSHHLAQM